jgi:hypothetical protein
VKTTLLEVNEGGLLVRLTRSARQWKTGEDKALIPKDQVGSVRFSGRVGSHGLIGGLVGLGAGAGIGAAIAMNSECIEGTACLIVLPVVGTAVAAAGGVAGYLIGRRTGQLAPEFVLTRQGGGEGDGTCAQWLEFWQ